MKILHINRNYLTSALHQVMMEHMEKPGLVHTVFAPTDDLNKSVIAPNDNVVPAQCFNEIDRFFFDIKQKKIQASLEKKIDVGQYDLIHAYTLFTDGNCARKLSQKYRIPYVVAVRNTDVNDFFRRLPFLRSRGIAIMRGASKVFFLSTAYRNQVFDLYVPEKFKKELWEKTEIIPNGIDDFWLANPKPEAAPEQAERIRNHKLNLIYAGRIDRNKNIPTTVAAARMLREEGWEVQLTVVGKVEDAEAYRSFADLPFVTYHPAVPKEELIHFYRGSDIFVMPSFTESFGLVYVEAMTQGLPVIYSKGQGFDGQFPDGTVGFAVDSGSAASVAEAIRKVADQYDSIAENCLSLAGKFRWEDICTMYAAIYRELEGRHL